MDRSSKIVIAILLFGVAIIFGLFASEDFTINSDPTMGHVYNLVYILAIVSITFLSSGIWLVFSSFRQPKNNVVEN